MFVVTCGTSWTLAIFIAWSDHLLCCPYLTYYAPVWSDSTEARQATQMTIILMSSPREVSMVTRLLEYVQTNCYDPNDPDQVMYGAASCCNVSLLCGPTLLTTCWFLSFTNFIVNKMTIKGNFIEYLLLWPCTFKCFLNHCHILYN